MAHWEAIEARRLALANDLADLSAAQWDTPSLCGAWAVRDVVAHMVLPLMPHVGTRFAVAFVKARGNFDRANQLATAKLRLRSPESLVVALRQHATARFKPPGFGPEASLTEVLVHGADVRIPLGIPDPGPVDAWAAALDVAFTPPRPGEGLSPAPRRTCDTS
jgi:uncharacterized protein (TIGR03083 family)